MTKLSPLIIEEAIHLLEAKRLHTKGGLQVYYSCYALAAAQGEHYDDIRFNERTNPYLMAYVQFSCRRFHCYTASSNEMPEWWNSNYQPFKQERLENLRLFKEAVEKGEIG